MLTHRLECLRLRKKALLFDTLTDGGISNERLAEIFSSLKESLQQTEWPCRDRERERERKGEFELKSTFVFVLSATTATTGPREHHSLILLAVTFTPFLVQFLTFCFAPLFFFAIDWYFRQLSRLNASTAKDIWRGTNSESTFTKLRQARTPQLVSAKAL